MSFEDLLPNGVVSLLPSKSLEALILLVLGPFPFSSPSSHGPTLMESTRAPIPLFSQRPPLALLAGPLLHFLF